MKGTRKEIAFDLDTKKLQKFYPKKDWRYAYREIRSFMRKNNFIWRQGSVYVSEGLWKNPEIAELLNNLANKQPWLNLCMRDCTVTNIGVAHNHTYIFNEERLMQKQQAKKQELEFERIEKEDEDEI